MNVPAFFNVFNIVAVLAVLVAGYFMYKKFTTKFKNGAIKVHFEEEEDEVFVPKPENPKIEEVPAPDETKED